MKGPSEITVWDIVKEIVSLPKMREVFYVFGNSDYYHSYRHLEGSEGASVYLKEHLGERVPCEECLANGWLKS